MSDIDDIEYVATDDELESVASFNSADTSNNIEEDCNNETVNSRRQQLLNEFTRVNGAGTIWSLNETGNTFEDHLIGDGRQLKRNLTSNTPQSICSTAAEPPMPLLKQLLAECEDFYKSEMEKAEQKVFQQMFNGMKSGVVESTAPDAVADENGCTCKKLKKKVEKLKLQLKAAQLLAVPALQFSIKSIDYVGTANERTTICVGNFGATRVAVRAYLVNELFPAIRIRPTELQIPSGQMRSIDLIWTGGQPTSEKSISNRPLSFSFKWTNVPEAGQQDDKCPLAWMNEYPIRQYYINVTM